MSNLSESNKKALEAMRVARVLAKENGVKLSRRNKLEVWQDDKLSLRKSIDAKCFDCSNYQMEEVRECTVLSCPLWYVRPYQVK